MHALLRSVASLPVCAALLGGCGADPATGDGQSAGTLVACASSLPASRFIACLDRFTPGAGAGHGEAELPGSIYGAPSGLGAGSGSLDVLSLGMGGELVFGFGGSTVVDEPGPDLVLFENAFLIGGLESRPYAELAEVAVSSDGVSWKAFPCSSTAYPFTGCAGWHAVYAKTAAEALEPSSSGGDAFDLADLGVPEARLVRLRDLTKSAAPDTAGFDLDAAAALHTRDP